MCRAILGSLLVRINWDEMSDSRLAAFCPTSSSLGLYDYNSQPSTTTSDEFRLLDLQDQVYLQDLVTRQPHSRVSIL